MNAEPPPARFQVERQPRRPGYASRDVDAGTVMSDGRIAYFMMNYDGDGWIRYRSNHLFAFSAPTDLQRWEIPFGDSAWRWIEACPVLNAGMWRKEDPSGLACTYALGMEFRRASQTLDDVLDAFRSTVSHSKCISQLVEGRHGPVPCAMGQTDEYLFEIRHYFLHGGLWTLHHRVYQEPPYDQWITIADRIAASIEFLAPSEKVQEQLYFEDAT